MGKFDHKKLLVLGSNVMADEAVIYARKNGAYTIVADYYDKENSKAKQQADEALMISTAQTEELIEYCKSKHIDGLFAGIGEFNLLQAMKISELIGTRFYCNRQQWDSIENKDQFRALCQKYGVPCPKKYFSGRKSELTDSIKESYRFPLVVKPVDCAASTGVTICTDMNNIDGAIDKAFSASGSGRIIVEQFVEGFEFTAHYTICGGKAALACIDNRYPVAVHEGKVTTIPLARIYPSLFIREYEAKVNDSMVHLCEGIGLDCAVIFVQGMYNPQSGEFNIFEAGLRSAAEAPCRILEGLIGQNHFNMMIDYILLGSTEYDISLENPDMGGKCAGIVSLVTTGGVVGKIEGLEDTVKTLPSILKYESRYPVGTMAPDGDTLRQLMIRFVMTCESRKKMMEDIEYINEHVFAYDINGKSMVLKIEPERLIGFE